MYKEYSTVIGLVALVLIIVTLFSTPGMILAKQANFIDTELSHASGHETSVRLKMDFGNAEYLAAFPTQFGDWTLNTEYDTSRTKESLGADLLFTRGYSRPGLYTPIYFTILQSDNRSSFHPPIVCYPALGFTIEGETTENITISNTSWVELPLFSPGGKKESRNRSISVKKLVVAKEADGSVKERRTVLYYYVKDNPITSDTVTMIRVSALIPMHGQIDADEIILNGCKELTSDTLPYLFEFKQEEEDIIVVSLIKSGLLGWFAIAVLLGLPLLVILYPKVKKR